MFGIPPEQFGVAPPVGTASKVMRFSSAMESIVDRAAARQHLELANKQVADSHRRVEAQVGLVARLARGGHDTFQARMLLGQFETSLALQVEARDCIVQELGESN
jgi:hypothetical protein